MQHYDDKRFQGVQRKRPTFLELSRYACRRPSCVKPLGALPWLCCLLSASQHPHFHGNFTIQVLPPCHLADAALTLISL